MKTLITNGDSWVFGSEIIDPKIRAKYPSNLHPGNYETNLENDEYRLPRIWPNKLGTLLGADVINLGYPADDNESIYERTIDYLTGTYINAGLPLNDIFVIVGWSSPERSRYWYKDDKINDKFILWPSNEIFATPAQKDIYRNYVTYQWNKEEYIPRFVHLVYRLQLFFEQHHIKYLMFNAFYQGEGSGCAHPLGKDINIHAELEKIYQPKYPYWNNHNRAIKTIRHQDIWKLVDPVKYYKKDQPENSFRTYISNRLENAYSGHHASEEAHTLWAQHLLAYIMSHKII